MTEVYMEHVGVATANIPPRFTQRRQWVCWRYEERNGEPTKVPYMPGTERKALTNDLTTWRPFKEAVEAYEAGRYDGIAFVFCSADPFVGIDLDKCRDPESGEIEEWALKIIDSITDKYVEASPSGRGIHIITRGALRGGRKKDRLEIYGQDRFFTFTGRVL